jgi:hypothetical protein
MKVTIDQLDTSTGVIGSSIVATVSLTSSSAPMTVTVAVPGSISGPRGLTGPQGPRGLTGPQGPVGLSATQTTVFTQAIPAAVWNINHNLGQFPAVDVVDSSGQIVEGDTVYVSSNAITLTFAGAFAGVAYLN